MEIIGQHSFYMKVKIWETGQGWLSTSRNAASVHLAMLSFSTHVRHLVCRHVDCYHVSCCLLRWWVLLLLSCDPDFKSGFLSFWDGKIEMVEVTFFLRLLALFDLIPLPYQASRLAEEYNLQSNLEACYYRRKEDCREVFNNLSDSSGGNFHITINPCLERQIWFTPLLSMLFQFVSWV